MPKLEETLTVFPDITPPLVFLTVTVIVEVDVPSAVTEVGEASTVDRLAETEGGI